MPSMSFCLLSMRSSTQKQSHFYYKVNGLPKHFSKNGEHTHKYCWMKKTEPGIKDEALIEGIVT